MLLKMHTLGSRKGSPRKLASRNILHFRILNQYGLTFHAVVESVVVFGQGFEFLFISILTYCGSLHVS